MSRQIEILNNCLVNDGTWYRENYDEMFKRLQVLSDKASEERQQFHEKLSALVESVGGYVSDSNAVFLPGGVYNKLASYAKPIDPAELALRSRPSCSH